MHTKDQLSPREWVVLSLVAQGLSNRQIACSLTITVNTLETHLRRIYQKLHLDNRSQATRWYMLHATSLGFEHLDEELKT